MGRVGRGCLRDPLRFPRFGCWQLGRRDAQQFAEPIGIIPSIGLDQHLWFGARIWWRVRHWFGMNAARGLSRRGRDDDALKLYDQALPRFDPTDPAIIDAARDAAVAAARTMSWERSAALFALAIDQPSSPEVPARLMGLHADRALALHLEGRSAEAMVALSAAAEPMLADVKGELSDPLLSTWMRVNEVAKMIAGDLEGHTPMDPTDDRLEFIRVRIVAALFVLAAAGKEATAPFASWRSSLPADDVYGPTRGLIDVAEQMFLREERPWNGLNPSPSAWEERLVIAPAATRRQRLTPDQLLICHGIWANFLRHPLLRDMSAAPTASLVTQDWLDRCESPAELVTPRLSVPAIRAAAAGGTTRWARVKAVLTAAPDAVSHQSRTFARPMIDGIEA